MMQKTICIDSNILIYAFNLASEFNEKAKLIISENINKTKISLCDISLVEFFQVITDKNRLQSSLDTDTAQKIINNIINNEIFSVLYTNNEIYNQVFNTMSEHNIKKYEIYDHIIAHTCKYYNISSFLTKNINDFRKYQFLNVIDPFI